MSLNESQSADVMDFLEINYNGIIDYLRSLGQPDPKEYVDEIIKTLCEDAGRDDCE